MTFLAKIVGVAVLPFVTFVKVAMYLYGHEHYPTALALAGGAACTGAVVAAYLVWLSRRFHRPVAFGTLARHVVLPVMFAYTAYAVLYVSSANVKAARVRTYYASLHPLLRLALSTVTIADRDLVITDLARDHGDYAAMGLPANDGSLHYRQRDGYAHAADLRTAGRSEVKNRLVQAYFWSMGFGTLRHVGTADHLHVELPAR